MAIPAYQHIKHAIKVALVIISLPFNSGFTPRVSGSAFDLSTELKLQATDPSLKYSTEMNKLRTLDEVINHRSVDFLKSILSKTIPTLDAKCHKGSSGRVAILGGSEKYSGAPFYAAMSALRTGADLATVFCAEEATIAIKSYSPELMVDSVYSAKKMQSNDAGIKELEVKQMVKRVTESLDRIHALVIGPGLGRDPAVLNATHSIIKEARIKGISMVLDADALYLLSLGNRDLLDSLGTNSESNCAIVLTPNVVEYRRLIDSLADGSEEELKKILPGVVVVKKGHHDVIERFPSTLHGSEEDDNLENLVMICEEKGGLKRSGGIGDILAGNIGTFLAWNRILESKLDSESDLLLSCWMASGITKRATNSAFLKRKRSMTAPDVLEEIGHVVDEVASSTILD